MAPLLYSIQKYLSHVILSAYYVCAFWHIISAFLFLRLRILAYHFRFLFLRLRFLAYHFRFFIFTFAHFFIYHLRLFILTRLRVPLPSAKCIVTFVVPCSPKGEVEVGF
jgi:hypothetical protein